MTNVSLLARGNVAELGFRLRDLLSPMDFQRIDRLRRAVDRDRAAVSAGLLRIAAAQAVDVPPGAVEVSRFCRTCGVDRGHGRPVVLLGPARGVHLSSSHAGDVVVVVASTSAPVGVDVELVELAGSPGFADTALHPLDRAELAVLDAPRRRLEQARRWTVTEAVLKAVGFGLALDPTGVSVGPDGRLRAGPPELLAEFPDVVVGGLSGLPRGYAGSVASRADEVPALGVQSEVSRSAVVATCSTSRVAEKP